MRKGKPAFGFRDRTKEAAAARKIML